MNRFKKSTFLVLFSCFLLLFSNHTYAKTITAPHIKQLPELPRGCEVTSLAMMIQNAGVKVGKMELAKEVRKVPFKTNGLNGNPYDGFVGNIYTFSQPGLGVYNGPIQELAEKYLPNRVVNLSGYDFSYIYKMLDKGVPVWVITNSWFSHLPSSQFKTWQTSSGPLKITYREHSVLVTGYDENYIYINDPLYHSANRAVNKAGFIAAWSQMGKQAISYYPQNADWYIDTVNHPNNKQIQALASYGLLNDTKNGFYQPNKVVDRAQAEKLFAILTGEKVGLMAATTGAFTRAELSQYIVQIYDVPKLEKVTLTDVPVNHQNYSAIQSVVSLKIVSKNPDGTFKPNQPVTKAEMAAALSQAISIYWYKDTVTHWARDEISYLKRRNLVSGISATKFGPNQPITRAQAAVLIDRALKIKVDPVKKLSFTDVKPTDPAYASISKVVQLGLIEKTQAFEPNKPMKRKEIALLFSRGLDLKPGEKPIVFKDVKTNSKYYESIQALASTRVISTNGPFNPENDLTRAQFASILAKLLQK
ncbi:hypothetical protein NEOCIP111885_02186 [Pseudoneobacillus rhizosphaerae]|uniref:SLH domain-containing protein n=2 Tax=Pseudoneobacillus rhizosphaerae TaxID=2880968 RepID=A0A9C7LAI8_9BACI|nr:hypothetical protein NEOCIP111885_02186 [Pseudoneobacillus rhizosphaerae]